jgi:hypothetical protein
VLIKFSGTEVLVEDWSFVQKRGGHSTRQKEKKITRPNKNEHGNWTIRIDRLVIIDVHPVTFKRRNKRTRTNKGSRVELNIL